MRVFELHFNPLKRRAKNKDDKIFDSFVYEPENTLEKKLGSLYIVGELNGILPQNINFLNNLSWVFKKSYYEFPLKKSSEISFQDAVKNANDFLDREARNGNVGWLGNLGLAVLNFNNFILNFTKVGNIKILLMRDEELLDIGQNLEFQDVEPYPLKIFGNVASGKLVRGDKIIIFTKDAFSAFTQDENFLGQLGRISDEKKLKEFLKINKKILSDASGICLLLIVDEELRPKESINISSEFSKFPKLKLPSLKIPSFKINLVVPKKNLILVLVLISILAIGFFIFGKEKEGELNRKIDENQQKIDQARSKIIMAESLLIFKKEEKAQALFKEAWDILTPIIKAGPPLDQEALSLQESVEKYLDRPR